MDSLDLVLSQGVNIITKREQNLNKYTEVVISENQILFNINPYHQYTVDMTFLGPKTKNPDPVDSDRWENPLMSKDLDINEGRGYKIIERRVGIYTLKERIFLPSHPIFSNKILDNWNLFDILNMECPPSWRNVFKISYKQFCVINEKLKLLGEKIVCPKKSHIFRAFELCPLSKVKVVIIGQDPYHTISNGGIPIANGLSFSVNKGIKTPPSLVNIYKELERSIPDFIIPDHGDLTSWALQGVLMMNVALTTYQHKANAHHKYWNGFTINTIRALNKLKPNCIYVLWGIPSRKLLKHINNHSLVLQSRHPSPMSVNKEYKNTKDKFTANNHFVKINELLKLLNKVPIDWTLQ